MENSTEMLLEQQGSNRTLTWLGLLEFVALLLDSNQNKLFGFKGFQCKMGSLGASVDSVSATTLSQNLTLVLLLGVCLCEQHSMVHIKNVGCMQDRIFL